MNFLKLLRIFVLIALSLQYKISTVYVNHKPIKKLNVTTQLPTKDDLEPTIVSQALKDPKWRQAMFEEYDAFVRNGT